MQVLAIGRLIVPLPVLYIHISPVPSGLVVQAVRPVLAFNPTAPFTSRVDTGEDVPVPALPLPSATITEVPVVDCAVRVAGRVYPFGLTPASLCNT